VERELDVTWEWNASLTLWVEQEATEVVKPTPIGRPPADRIPCQGIAATAYSDYQEPTEVITSATWNSRPELDQPVCVLDGPKPSAPVAPSDPTRVTLRRTEVLQVLGCSAKASVGTEVVVEAINVGKSEVKKEGVEQLRASPEEVGHEYNIDPDDLGIGDLGSDSAGDSESGSEDTVPFRFIKGHRLGTSDMQIRAVSLGTKLSDTDLEDETPPAGSPEEIQAQIEAEAKARESVHRQALRVIGITRWGRGSDSNTLSKASEIWGRFAVAQAEYYFNVNKSTDVLADWKGWDNDEKSDGGRDFLWAMNWTARMRRFRFSYEVDGESADGPSNADAEGSGNDEMASRLGIDISMDQNSDQIASDGPSAACEKIDQLKDICGQLKALDGVFIH
jgi:hypothetical protein